MLLEHQAIRNNKQETTARVCSFIQKYKQDCIVHRPHLI